jgi:hypothetical protein
VLAGDPGEAAFAVLKSGNSYSVTQSLTGRDEYYLHGQGLNDTPLTSAGADGSPNPNTVDGQQNNNMCLQQALNATGLTFAELEIQPAVYSTSGQCSASVSV